MTEWDTERDGGRQRVFIGDAQEFSKLGLNLAVPAGQHSPITKRPRCEQQVLAGGIDRGPVDQGLVALPYAGEHNNWSRLEVVDGILHRASHSRLWR